MNSPLCRPLTGRELQRLETMFRDGLWAERRLAQALGVTRVTLRRARAGRTVAPETRRRLVDWLESGRGRSARLTPPQPVGWPPEG